MNHALRHPRLAVLIVLALVLAAAGVARGDDADPLAGGGERHLNGHGFLPSLFVGDPFVSSTFQNHTGGGVAMDYRTEFKDLDGSTLFTLKGDVFFASLGLGYQQKLWSRWGVGMMIAGAVRAGTNAETFISDGADLDRTGSLWVDYRLRRGDRSQLSVGADWSYAKQIYFTPGDFARWIEDGGSIEDAPIVVSEKTWTSRFVVKWAYAFSRAFAARLSGAFGLYEPPLAAGVSKGSHRIGALGEFDMKEVNGIPLGFTLGYTQALPDDDPFVGMSGTLLGLWYTGKEAFVVGVEAGAMRAPVTNQVSDKVKAAFGVITIRYYF